MELVGKLYRGFLYAMAGIAGLMLVWLMISVIMSVVMRNAGLQPFAWLFTSSEYAILYMTMLGAPWLVREKGHVHIELVTAALPSRMRRVVSRLVAAACVTVSLILAWKGLSFSSATSCATIWMCAPTTFQNGYLLSRFQLVLA